MEVWKGAISSELVLWMARSVLKRDEGEYQFAGQSGAGTYLFPKQERVLVAASLLRDNKTERQIFVNSKLLRNNWWTVESRLKLGGELCRVDSRRG